MQLVELSGSVSEFLGLRIGTEAAGDRSWSTFLVQNNISAVNKTRKIQVFCRQYLYLCQFDIVSCQTEATGDNLTIPQDLPPVISQTVCNLFLRKQNSKNLK